MRFWTGRARFGWALVLAAATGCDGFGSTGPARPRAVPVTQTPMVALILPADGFEELEVWEATARREQVRTKTLTDIRKVAPGDPPEKQAELIRSAVNDGANAVIVLTTAPGAVAKVLDEVRSEGIPVVLLERDVPLSGTPAPRVTYASDRETAKSLVDVAVARARSEGFPPEGPALILFHGRSDERTRARVKALREELGSRGVRVLPDVNFWDLDSGAANALKAVFPSVPHLAMVFALDDVSLKGTATFRHGQDRTQRRFVMAGFTHEPRTVDFVKYNLAAGVVDRNLSEIIHIAFDTALAMLRGETVPLVVESPTPMNIALGKEKEGEVPPFLSVPEMMQKLPPEKNESFPVIESDSPD